MPIRRALRRDFPPALLQMALNPAGRTERFDFGWGAASFDITGIVRGLLAGEIGFERVEIAVEHWRHVSAVRPGDRPGAFKLAPGGLAAPKVDRAAVEHLCRHPGLLRHPCLLVRFGRAGGQAMHLLIDGNHRLHAALLLGRPTLPALLIDDPASLGACLEASSTFWRALGREPRGFGSRGTCKNAIA